MLNKLFSLLIIAVRMLVQFFDVHTVSHSEVDRHLR